MYSNVMAVNQLNKFDATKCLTETGAISLIIGKRQSGKSWILRELISMHVNLGGTTIVYAEDVSLDGPKTGEFHSYNDYNASIFDDLLKNRASIVSNDPNTPCHLLILNDICVNNLYRDVSIQTIFKSSKELRINIIVAMGTPLGIMPELRGKIDYVFTTSRLSINRDIHQIFDFYAGFIPYFNQFKQLIEQYSQNYGWLVLCNTPSTSPKELNMLVMYYKAEHV